MNVLNRAVHLLKDHRGQSLIMLALLTPALFALLATIVDVGLLLGERTGAQRAVDAAALAGAEELAKDLRAVPGGTEDTQWGVNAENRALEWVQRNSIEPDEEYRDCPVDSDLGSSATEDNACADTSCFADDPGDIGLKDTITVDAEGPSGTWFGKIFGANIVGVGAHAKACVGSLVATTGVRPWTISRMCSDCFEWIDDDKDGIEEDTDTYIPRYGEDCVFRSDGKTETESAVEPRCEGESRSQVGSVRLGPDEDDECWESSGGNDYRDNVIGGAGSECHIDDVISTEPGFKTGPTQQGLTALLEGEGQCDSSSWGDHNGIDDFGEAFTPADAEPSDKVVYTPRGCTTPRAVNIVIMDKFDGNGIDHQPIRGFAAFYILQCEVVDKQSGEITVYPDCPKSMPSDFQIRGRFMQILDLEGKGGALDPYGTRVIFLAE